jgi:acylphosphatase
LDEKASSCKRIVINVKGRVQGVCFRHYTQKKANELEVMGFVKNEPDGSVTIVVEGECKACEKLLNWASSGPSHARVDKIKSDTQKYQNEFKGFNIRY